MSQPLFVCKICGKLVPLEEARTDGDGNAVHEACLASKLTHTDPEQIPSKPSE
jgi:hypothetical protein